MGLASALSTALTGLTAAETTIDVVGNNLANSNTVGFKASEAAFATQFLQTRGLGSAPTGYSGGTNPRQIGLGAIVADIAPSFTQGTIEISANPTDLAIQGDGFFIVQGGSGEQLYTRNGIFKMNAQSELITITGNRLLGYGVDDQFQIQSTTLTALEIPLGAAAVAKATENVYLEGTLSPTGDVADTAEIIQTGILSDDQYTYPTTEHELSPAAQPDNVDIEVDASINPGNVLTGTYFYRTVWADSPYGANPDSEGVASAATAQVDVDNGAGENSVQIDDWSKSDDYSHIRFYRTLAPAGVGGPYYYVGEAAMDDASFNDVTADLEIDLATDQLDESTISGNYSYYVTFAQLGGLESRPSELVGPLTVDGRIHITDLPVGDDTEWDVTRIYRNLSTNSSTFFRVAEIPNVAGTGTFTDNVDDTTLADNEPIDLDGPKITPATLLSDVRRRDGSSYETMFEVGTLDFTGRKGGRSLPSKRMEITATSTVLDLTSFMEEAMGIQEPPGPDTLHPIPPTTNPIPGDPPLYAGGSVTADGRIRLIGNNGVDNALDIGLSGMQLITTAGQDNVNMPFTSLQTAVGESAVADFIVYDSLGIPLAVRLTAVLESRNSTSTTYRWFADSADNDPSSGVQIAVGTGLLVFDGEGNFTTATQERVSIDRRNVSSTSPLEVELDFSQISGLHTDDSTLAVSRQDGSSPGVLTSFIVGEDGRITGVFSNGITRDLGQIRLARFGNPTGLEQKGENMYATGVNSGLPVEGNPGEQGIGSIIAGAVELSNTDIGSNLIDLILASTMYRGNTRVITTSQQMLDELLSIRR